MSIRTHIRRTTPGLTGSQSALSGITQTRNAKVGEMEVDGGDMVISGVKTVQVEIKE